MAIDCKLLYKKALGGFIEPTHTYMNQFIGTKMVEAEPMTKGAAFDAGLLRIGQIAHTQREEPGYKVVYNNGYESWSPANVFEATYKAVDGMTFGCAIQALKAGHKVARKGWNGKGMFLWLKPAATVKAEWCKDPMLKGLAEANGGEIEALGTICMFTAQKQILSGWLASQTDMLAEDWIIVSE